MKNLLTKTLVATAFCGFFWSCSVRKTVQVSTPVETENTPAISPSAIPITTLGSPTSEEIAVTSLGPLCTNSKDILGSEISPNGKWIAAQCYWENEGDESPLQVVSLDRSKDWKIYFHDYVKGSTEYGRKNIIVPYHWSKDRRFLYAVSPTIGSGCCWIGGKYVLLVRLNLETGKQTEIIKGTDFGSDLPFTFTISENDRFLLFTPITDESYDFTVLDLVSWETRVVKLKPEFDKDINLEFAVMSPYEDIIVLPLFEHLEFNEFKVHSIAMIDLTTGEQSLLVSDLKQYEELYPIQWIDADRVLLSSTNPSIWYEQESAEHWSLNIKTGQREKLQKP